ncbi:MAG: pseudouridine synthase [Patescibacteria group bacterium]
MKDPKFPMRINQYLAWQKHSTRRGGDELVQKRQILINGRFAELGDKVNEKDIVEVLKNKKSKNYLYFAYNKPVGETTDTPIFLNKEIFPLGRLDKDSNGLMLLTNDGRVTDRLLNPEYAHEKEYIVTVKEKLRANFKQKMEAGVDIEGYQTKKCRVDILNSFTFKITLTEGKKHQIRRMCVALHNQVKNLKRIRIMNIELGNLPPGSHRAIGGEELKTFLKNLGL